MHTARRGADAAAPFNERIVTMRSDRWKTFSLSFWAQAKNL